jgi:glutathione synthase/RimK-type ligase-like ATP-grasp enzyme
MALEVAKVLGIKFASIDIVELYDGKLLVLEANSGVMMNNFSVNLSEGKNIAKIIYTKVLEDMFK